MNWGGDSASTGGGIGGYDRWDLRLAKRIRWLGSQLLLELIGQNCGGEPYAESRRDNRFDTRTFIRGSVQLYSEPGCSSAADGSSRSTIL